MQGSMASSLFSLPSLLTTLKAQRQRPAILPCSNFIQPNLTLKFPRLGISYSKRKESRQVSSVVISCLVEDNPEACQGSEGSSGSHESNPGATIDLKLPRRSLLLHFTCNSCGVRSQKLINRFAYEKGTVFVQCTGCLQYHKLVDNLNLVVEYDLREEIDTSSDTITDKV
ncbi:uncharacterized protein LOC111896516 isoform X2 [Lactuca sativa]|uniref:uncharacterized protein LOC111896516 isoform X2 n=1 Tax=Lactuca sativa TaxID=4236 RepID=UPI000CB86FD1|nr:uncharacterized protein LOC111896516 isoform X2 [Lactuca sativa]